MPSDVVIIFVVIILVIAVLKEGLFAFNSVITHLQNLCTKTCEPCGSCDLSIWFTEVCLLLGEAERICSSAISLHCLKNYSAFIFANAIFFNVVPKLQLKYTPSLGPLLLELWVEKKYGGRKSKTIIPCTGLGQRIYTLYQQYLHSAPWNWNKRVCFIDPCFQAKNKS